jgi:hypothetical protein
MCDFVNVAFKQHIMFITYEHIITEMKTNHGEQLSKILNKDSNQNPETRTLNIAFDIWMYWDNEICLGEITQAQACVAAHFLKDLS